MFSLDMADESGNLLPWAADLFDKFAIHAPPVPEGWAPSEQGSGRLMARASPEEQALMRRVFWTWEYASAALVRRASAHNVVQDSLRNMRKQHAALDAIFGRMDKKDAPGPGQPGDIAILMAGVAAAFGGAGEQEKPA